MVELAPESSFIKRDKGLRIQKPPVIAIGHNTMCKVEKDNQRSARMETSEKNAPWCRTKIQMV